MLLSLLMILLNTMSEFWSIAMLGVHGPSVLSPGILMIKESILRYHTLQLIKEKREIYLSSGIEEILEV